MNESLISLRNSKNWELEINLEDGRDMEAFEENSLLSLACQSFMLL